MKTNNGIRTVAVTTLGCKVNQFESASFQDGFRAQGLEVVDFARPADIYVINTCAVTAKAAAQSRQMIRRALRSGVAGARPPRVVVTGCYAQVAGREILADIDRAVCLVGNADKHLLVAAALSDNPGTPAIAGEVGRQTEICRLPVRQCGERTRAFLKIQDGCNNFCSYCIVPYARGRSRSLPPAEVLAQAEVFARAGYKELVLSGIHAGAYGQDLQPAVSLLDLLVRLARHLPAIRFRLSSLEPTEISPALLDFLAETGNFMPHLHIPLQSGDDAILKKMNRRYTGRDFAAIVREIIRLLPEAAIGVDVLVGFPGEDDQAFLNTRQLLADLPVAYLHVFPYSRRPGTVAAGMAAQVPSPVKENRVADLRRLDHGKRLAFYAGNIGRTHRVLVEGGNNRAPWLKGFSENYIPVNFKARPDAANQVLAVKIEELVDRRVFGRVIGEGG